jgi:hypothetical protein
MLSGRAPFHAQSRDDSAAAVMARIKGGEFDFYADAWNHVSAQAKYVTKGKNFLHQHTGIWHVSLVLLLSGTSLSTIPVSFHH